MGYDMDLSTFLWRNIGRENEDLSRLVRLEKRKIRPVLECLGVVKIYISCSVCQFLAAGWEGPGDSRISRTIELGCWRFREPVDAC